MSNSSQTIEGSVEKVLFHSDDTGYAVLKVMAENDAVCTVVGHFNQVFKGETYTFKGDWSKHPRFGVQFKTDSYFVKKPNTLSGIEKYLASGLIKGVGPITAKRIVETFGLETFEMLDKQPEKLDDVSGLGSHRKVLIKKGWVAQRKIHDLMLFLQNHGVSASFAVKIYKTYGDQSIQILQENPYRLANDIFRIGFKTADDIALKIGISKTDPKRLTAGLLHTLKNAGIGGNCYLPEEELYKNAYPLFGGETSKSDLKFTLDEMILNEEIIVEMDSETTVRNLYSPLIHSAEKSVALSLRELLKQKISLSVGDDVLTGWLEKYEKENDFKLTTEQREASLEGVKNPVFILTGGPGTGKTTITKAIVSMFEALRLSVTLASPTGRAAQRMSEVVGKEAKTIHRLLEFEPKGYGFKRGKNNPLDGDVLIVDEASMLDIQLAKSLLEAVPKSMQVLFIGDADQLPSVGPGNFLSDCISSEQIPCKKLQKIHRQSETSGIVMGAHEINEGIWPEFSKTKSGDLFFIEEVDPEKIASRITDMVSRSVPGNYPHLEIPGDVQVLSPMNRGLIGNEKLNELIQSEVNPEAKGKGEVRRQGFVFREGDRVLQCVNNYDLNVFNGDFGTIVKIDTEDQEMIAQFGDREVVYDFSELDELKLSYSISIHKSQGSEFKAVIIPVHTQHFMMLERNLVYTALTRAKKLAIFVGTKKAFQMALNRVGSRKRYTGLTTKLNSI